MLSEYVSARLQVKASVCAVHLQRASRMAVHFLPCYLTASPEMMQCGLTLSLQCFQEDSEQ